MRTRPGRQTVGFIWLFGMLALLVGLAVPACASGEHDNGPSADNSDAGDGKTDAPAAKLGIGLDVNDVSLLFPLTKVGSGALDYDVYPSITLSGAPFFNATLLDRALEIASDLGVDFVNNGISHWRVTAVRYDPRGRTIGVAGSLPQIRLVIQNIRSVPGPGIDDVAIHLVFTAGDAAPGAADPIIAELRAIQHAAQQAGNDTVGKPLGPHPGLLAEASARKGPVGDLVRAFVTSHCTLASLHELTFTGTDEGSDSWFFFAAAVADGKLTRVKVPNVIATVGDASHAAVDALSIGLLGLDDDQVIFPAPVATAASLAPIMNVPTASVSAETLATLHQIENPLETTIANTDCASCHASSRLILHWKLPFTGSIHEYTNPVGLTGFAELATQPADDGSSVRNFGWLFTTAVVTTLTANSSAAAADAINRSQRWRNPSGRDCSAPAVRECFAGRGTGGETTPGTAMACLQLCTKLSPSAE